MTENGLRYWSWEIIDRFLTGHSFSLEFNWIWDVVYEFNFVNLFVDHNISIKSAHRLDRSEWNQQAEKDFSLKLKYPYILTSN